MSSTLTISSNRSALCKASSQNTNYSTGDTFSIASNQDCVLVGFDVSSIPSAVLTKKLTGAKVYLYGTGAGSIAHLYKIDGAWTENSVTYATRPASSDNFNTDTMHFDADGEWGLARIWNGAITKALVNGGAQFTGIKIGTIVCTSRHASLAPYIVIEYEDEAPTSRIWSASPSSGYIPKNTAKKFSWQITQDGYCISDVTVTSSKFRWKESGGTATEINCGTNLYYTLAGASITADSILWQCEVVDSLGNTVTSDWYTLSTVEATSTAVALEPVSTMVDGSSGTVFRWGHMISTGTAPTGADLQYSTNGSSWSTLATVSGSATSTTIAAGTLPSGNVYWRVRTYNTDSAAGSWSSAANVFVINAPDAPVVSVEQTPRPLIIWQASGQEGYQIRISGVWESGSVYGIDNSKKCPVIIPDGEYAVEVRVVNEYGLWSEWGSAPLTVANSAGSSITLTATASGSVYLTWTTSGTYERYLVERDGDPVAVTEETIWTDLTAVGEHQYTVYGLISGSDNYTASNTITISYDVFANSITDLDTGDVLELPYSITQIREEQISFAHEVSVTHVSGAAYPFAEIAQWKDKSLQFEAAFDVLENAKRLEAMVGHLVCIKAKNNESVIGVLPSLRKTSSAFWVDYTGTIEQIDRTEEVEL